MRERLFFRQRNHGMKSAVADKIERERERGFPGASEKFFLTGGAPDGEKAAHDIGNTGEKAAQDTGVAAATVVRFAGRELQGVGTTLTDAAKRVREGKIVDAIWQQLLARAARHYGCPRGS